MTEQELKAKLEAAEKEIEVLKESRGAVVKHEQTSRVECNRLRGELNKAEACCAEMREALLDVSSWAKTHGGWDPSMVRHALSSDCGKDFRRISDFKPLVEALKKVSGFGRADMGHQQMCDYVTFEAEEALALARKLGIE